MFFYEVGYSSYEECPIKVICHEKEFTSDEFDEIMMDCYVKISKKQEKETIEWLNNSPELSEEDKEWYKYKPTINMLYSDVYDLLIDEYGFTEPTIKSIFVISDTEDIVPSKDREFKDTYCSKLSKLRHRFNVIEPRDNKIYDILADDGRDS